MQKEAKMENPIYISIATNPQKSVILKNRKNEEDISLNPGAMFGEGHYGFILISDTKEGKKRSVYPTQNRIDAIGTDGDILGDIKVFEYGKFNPWRFSCTGELKEESSYNPNSRKDIEYVAKTYDMTEEEAISFISPKSL